MNQLLTMIDTTSVVAFVIATGVFLLIAMIYTRSKQDPGRARVDRIAPEQLHEGSAGHGLFGPLTSALASQIPESAKERRDFGLLLRQAGLYHPAARISIYALRFVLLVVPMLVAGVWAVAAEPDQTWKILLIGGLAAGALSITPRLYVFFRRRRRLERIRQGLPDTIDMLSMCSSGGMVLGDSIDHVADQIHGYPELAQELRILKRQAEVGSLDQALVDFSIRADLPEARHLASLLTRGSQLGTQLAGSLNEQADHLRVTRRQMATAQANKTPVKLVFPILFCFAPAALIMLTGPAVLELRDFFRPSQESALGQGFGSGAIVDTMETLEQPTGRPSFGSESAPTMPEP